MRNKKRTIKIIVICGLITISVLLFGTSISMSKYNVDPKVILLNKLKKEKIHDIKVVKTNTHNSAAKFFKQDDIEYIKSKVGSTITDVFNIKEYDSNLSIVLNEKKENNNIYYTKVLGNNFEVVDNWSNLKLIGDVPVKEHETVITKYIADMIIEKGVFIYQKGEKKQQRFIIQQVIKR